MGILRLGSQIGQTVKNVARLKTILVVMGRHGLAEIAERMRLDRLIPGFKFMRKGEEGKRTLPERVRLTFEELGPTFVKLGQVLSTRPDLIPQEYAEEFKKLQDHVPAVPFDMIKKTIEAEFGRPYSEVYKTFNETPLAAASIAQVHEATLHDGTEVVVKVQRAGIDKLIDTDVSILFVIAGLLEKYIEEARVFNPTGIVEEFFKTLKKELDFVVEAGNMMKIRKNFQDRPHVVIPQVFRSYSTTRVLTLEKLKGIRLSDRKALESSQMDIRQLAHEGVQAFYKMVLVDGIFHGDLHAGNIFILEDGKIGLVDFGIVGRLNQKVRDALGNMFLALVSEDFDALVYEYLEIGIPTGKTDIDHFSKQVRELVEPYFGLPLKDVNVGRMLLDLSILASQHGLRMSQDLMLVCKAIVTIEGMGRSIDPDFDIVKGMSEFAKVLLEARYNMERLSKELFYLMRDVTSLVQHAPRQLRLILKKLSSDEWVTRIKIEDIEHLDRAMTKGRQLLSLSIITACVIISATLLLIFHQGTTLFGLSTFGFIGFVFSGVLIFLYFVSYFRK